MVSYLHMFVRLPVRGGSPQCCAHQEVLVLGQHMHAGLQRAHPQKQPSNILLQTGGKIVNN